MTKQAYQALVAQLKAQGYEYVYAVCDDAGTGGVFFHRAADGSRVVIRKGVVEGVKA